MKPALDCTAVCCMLYCMLYCVLYCVLLRVLCVLRTRPNTYRCSLSVSSSGTNPIMWGPGLILPRRPRKW